MNKNGLLLSCFPKLILLQYLMSSFMVNLLCQILCSFQINRKNIGHRGGSSGGHRGHVPLPNLHQVFKYRPILRLVWRTQPTTILAMIEFWLVVPSDWLNYGRVRRVVQTVSVTTTSLSISRTEVIRPKHVWHLKPATSGDCPRSCFACLTRLALADRTLAQRLLSRRPLH